MVRRDGTRTLRVADGRWVWLRPIRRGDLPALNAMLTGLSPRSRRLRFHGAVNALPCTALRDLAAPGDEHHATLVAQAYSADGIARLVAEARWVRETPGAETAEFALSVADDWQRQGLARALLDRLRASAAQAGVQRLYGSVLDENRGMLQLLASQGARPRRDPRGGWGVVWMLEIGDGSPFGAEPARLPSRFPAVPMPTR
jgi:acetyltransferase